MTTHPSPLKARYHDVLRRVAEDARRSGRRPRDILLVAVTKNAHPEQIRELIELGHADFGENRVQNLAKRVANIEEFIERHHTLTSSREVRIPDRIRWHMIGHLQRNKVKKVLDLVTLIQSVDTLRLAEEIQDVAMKSDEPVDVLVQVNASFEESKYGCALAAAKPFAELLDTMVGLRVRGLMTMAPFTEDANMVRTVFERCRDSFEEIRKAGVGGKHFNILSMGMTNDFETAIECGANMVRIGTAIFGTPDDPAPTTAELEEESADESSSSALSKPSGKAQPAGTRGEADQDAAGGDGENDESDAPVPVVRNRNSQDAAKR